MRNNGFKNEKKLINALHNKQFIHLNSNLQQLIAKSFQDYEGLILCKGEAGLNKSDLIIQIGKETHTYSVKMGQGNSVHQEPLESFLVFLEKEFNLDASTKEAVQQFIWADGTNDGTGNIKDRLSARKFKKRHPKLIKKVQKFFNQHKEQLLKRFLITGVHSSTSAEFIYYGTVKKGIVCKSEDIIKWVATHYGRGTLNIAKLTFQAWNRNLKGKRKAEKKRGVIQLKWGSLKKDIRKIAKINLGKQQEVDFVKTLNKKENLLYWQTLGIETKNHHAIRVIYQQYGSINKRKVWAKADAFIAKGEIPKHYLKLNHYFLDEDDVKKFKLIPIKHSGISIKKASSQNYSIAKISPSTFQKLFDSNILAAGVSLYYKKRSKLAINKKILQAWGIEEEDFFAYYSQKLNLAINSVSHSNCQSCLKKIKRYAKKMLIKAIKEDKEISAFIFFGMGNFQEPFTAPWLYTQGSLKANTIGNFSITTGSGRSKGHYSIVIKPK